MSLSYAESLSYFPHKGKVGMPELSEKLDDLQTKLEKFGEMIRQSRHTVVITGAGISTAAGIPDFRGPNGVWTLEKRGLKPTFNTSFDHAVPTYTHRALSVLEKNNYLQFVISQNIDGLHHRSGLPLEKLAELHGNVFAEECEVCRTQVIRPKVVGSYCRKRTGNVCNTRKSRNKSLVCRGKLRDTVLDWEDPLPELALALSEQHCTKADLCICLGTSLQIRPCRDLPRKTKKNGGKIVIVNLQRTSMDSIADLIIHERCDVVIKHIMDKLNLTCDEIAHESKISKYSHVKRIIVLWGKTKTGKTYISKKLAEQLHGVLLNMNDVVMDEYAKQHSQDIDEEHITKWREEKCGTDSSWFCQAMIEQNDEKCASHTLWIVDGLKSSKEILFFYNHFKDQLTIVNVEASDEIRQKRGSNGQIDVHRSESEDQSDENPRPLFTFYNNDENDFNSQMNTLLSIINC